MLLQSTTIFITIYDRYYNSWQSVACYIYYVPLICLFPFMTRIVKLKILM